MSKERLDTLLAQRGLAPSREMARRYIQAGEVRVNGQIADKPGMMIPDEALIEVAAAPPYVSRGGEKLAAAFAAFPLEVNGAVCADVGASTGGFSDCLLQHGAARVYAIDVGYGQMALKLRDDPRMVMMERTNARYVAALPEPVRFVCVDASFISLRILLPVIRGWLGPGGEVVALIKPQFEAGKKEIGKGGVVKNADTHRRVLLDILGAAAEMGYTPAGLIRSPLTGPKGNIEFLAWLRTAPSASALDIPGAVEAVLAS